MERRSSMMFRSPTACCLHRLRPFLNDLISTIKRYREVYGKAGPYLQAMCIAGKGYWYKHG